MQGITNNKLFIAALIIALLASAFSQFPNNYENSSKYVVIWLLPAFIAFVSGKMTLLPIKNTLIFFIVFQIFAFALDGITSGTYAYRNDVNLSFSPVAMFELFMGVQCGRLVKKKTFCKILFYTSLFSLPILDYQVLHSSFNTFGLEDYLQVSTYKNQIAPVLVSHLCVIALLSQDKGQIMRWGFYGLLVVTAYTILGLRSRTSMLSLVILIVFLFFNLRSKKERLLYKILVISAVSYAVYNWNMIGDTFSTMALKGSDDVSDISSGRTDIWNIAIIRFFENPIIGLGSAAGNVENFYLQSLLAFGILGFPLAVSFVYIPLNKFRNMFVRTDTLHQLTLIVVCIFMFNAFLERTPPIGPGIRCLYFWLLLGFCISVINKKNFYAKKK